MMMCNRDGGIKWQRRRRGVTLEEEEEEGLHWCVQAATPQRTPGIPESEEEEGLHWCVQAAAPQRTPGTPESGAQGSNCEMFCGVSCHFLPLLSKLGT
jgi:hypothetical protein